MAAPCGLVPQGAVFAGGRDFLQPLRIGDLRLGVFQVLGRVVGGEDQGAALPDAVPEPGDHVVRVVPLRLR